MARRYGVRGSFQCFLEQATCEEKLPFPLKELRCQTRGNCLEGKAKQVTDGPLKNTKARTPARASERGQALRACVSALSCPIDPESEGLRDREIRAKRG